MIISAPTALYLSILPKTPSDPGNITWTISSNDPPRITEVLFIVPQIEELRPLPPIIFDPAQRQVDTGDYVFNLSYTNKSMVGIGSKSYEAGQVLEFGDEEDVAAATILLVPDILDLQQNTNFLDPTAAGLTDDEASRLTVESRKKLNNTISSLNETLALIKQLEVSILDNQKSINETTKMYDASVSSLGPDDEITKKLSSRITALQSARTDLITSHDSANNNANNQYTQILSIKEMVR